jgi:hypothetical protein
MITSFTKYLEKEDSYKYCEFPFSLENIYYKDNRGLDLLSDLLSSRQTFLPLLPLINNDEWFIKYYGDDDKINVFVSFFISKYRNYKTNYYKYVNYTYQDTNRNIYKFTEYYSKWWNLMYNDMSLDIISMINNNREKYKRLYNLFDMEYNPLWNVDGTESRTIVHSGSISNTSSNTTSGNNTLVTSFTDFLKTNEKTLNDIFEKSGIETDTRTLDTIVAYLGSEDLTKTGSEDLTKTGTETNTKSSTTFNNDTEYETGKDVTTYTNRKDTTGFNNRKDTKSYTDRQDKNTGTDTLDKTFTDRQDTRNITETDTEGYTGTKTDTTTTSNTSNASNSGTDSYNNTDNLIRQGNIGITSSQNLFNQELDLLGKIVLYDTLASDIANEFLILNKGV